MVQRHDNEPYVTVTLTDVYLEVRDLRDLVTRIAATDADADHEDRIRRVEKWSYAIPGSLLLGVASVLLAWVA